MAKNAKFSKVLHINIIATVQVLCVCKHARLPTATKKLKVRNVMISTNCFSGMKNFPSIEVTLACTTGKVDRVPKKLRNISKQTPMNDDCDSEEGFSTADGRMTDKLVFSLKNRFVYVMSVNRIAVSDAVEIDSAKNAAAAVLSLSTKI